mmetsp:Transcript_82634/g.258008  ORF Transcript_82634/g.258008 Transcript_82634/m.258008 type:complete len:117 (+) Transcript_82634:1184-1534(+)
MSRPESYPSYRTAVKAGTARAAPSCSLPGRTSTKASREGVGGQSASRLTRWCTARTTESAYATANRDEFFAEAVSICRGVMDNEDVYVKCGISTKELLQGEMPDLYTFLAKYFSMP